MNEFENNELRNDEAETGELRNEMINGEFANAAQAGNELRTNEFQNEAPDYTGYSDVRNFGNESADYTREIIDCTGTQPYGAKENIYYGYANNQNEKSNIGYNNAPQYGYMPYTNSQQNDIGNNYPPESYITIKNIETKKNNKSFPLKEIKTAAIIAVCCASLGVGLGAGVNVGRSYLKNASASSQIKTQTGEGGGFMFPEIETSGQNDTQQEDNVILTGTNTIAPIINNVWDSVVNVSMIVQTTGFFNQVYEGEGAGSGVIYGQDDEKVYIVTNNHVVDGASSVMISITGEEQVPASLVGKDASSDLALISVLKSDLSNAGITEVKPAVFADSDNMEVGEYVLALGNALGEGKTVTQGIISAQNKSINVDGKKLEVLQTDAAINPGNSGGALINTDGEVVGINTAKNSGSSVEGIGYAIPANHVREIVEELKTNGSIERPYLGIVGATITDEFKSAYNINIDGVFLTGVERSSAAEAAGLKRTDIITAFNGEKVTSIDQLSELISKCKSGDSVNIDFIRYGTTPMRTTAVLTNYNQNF